MPKARFRGGVLDRRIPSLVARWPRPLRWVEGPVNPEARLARNCLASKPKTSHNPCLVAERALPTRRSAPELRQGDEIGSTRFWHASAFGPQSQLVLARNRDPGSVAVEMKYIGPDNDSLPSQMGPPLKLAGHECQSWEFLSSVIDQKPKDSTSYQLGGERSRQQADKETTARWFGEPPIGTRIALNGLINRLWH